MKLAILFWFYKNARVCRNRLQMLRRHNPDTAIYGLYGGDSTQVDHFKTELAPYLDDFFDFSAQKDAKWKWLYGDLLIAEWYRQRGQFFHWDTIIIVQWDMLIFGKMEKVFSELREGEILLSGLRPVEEVRMWWKWTSENNPAEHERYNAFIEHVRKEFDFKQEPLCCQFIVACLPRDFLERYINITTPELGFIEYRLPVYAQIFGTPFCKSEKIKCWWGTDLSMQNVPTHERVINAVGLQQPIKTIFAHLARPDGARIFHPFNHIFPFDLASAAQVFRDLASSSRYGAAFKRLTAGLSKTLRSSSS